MLENITSHNMDCSQNKCPTFLSFYRKLVEDFWSCTNIILFPVAVMLVHVKLVQSFYIWHSCNIHIIMCMSTLLLA